MEQPVPAGEGPAPAWLDRTVAGVAVAAAAALVALLLPIEPDARGFGTHEALGAAPCGWPANYEIPCPTCGCTTAACHVVHLQPLHALRAHPFGAVVTMLGFWVAGLALHDLVRGRAFLARAWRMRPARWLLGGLLLLGVSWLYKWLSFAP